jgi:hypothetical protein
MPTNQTKDYLKIYKASFDYNWLDLSAEVEDTGKSNGLTYAIVNQSSIPVTKVVLQFNVSDYDAMWCDSDTNHVHLGSVYLLGDDPYAALPKPNNHLIIQLLRVDPDPPYSPSPTPLPYKKVVSKLTHSLFGGEQASPPCLNKYGACTYQTQVEISFQDLEIEVGDVIFVIIPSACAELLMCNGFRGGCDGYFDAQGNTESGFCISPQGCDASDAPFSMISVDPATFDTPPPPPTPGDGGGGGGGGNDGFQTEVKINWKLIAVVVVLVIIVCFALYFAQRN